MEIYIFILVFHVNGDFHSCQCLLSQHASRLTIDKYTAMSLPITILNQSFSTPHETFRNTRHYLQFQLTFRVTQVTRDN